MSGAHLVSLGQCVDAVEATGQVGASDLQRLEETLYALRTLAYLQPNISQVSCLVKYSPHNIVLSFFCTVTARCHLPKPTQTRAEEM